MVATGAKYLLNGEALSRAFASERQEKVLAFLRLILKFRAKVTKHSSVKVQLPGGTLLQVAVSLLHDAGLVRRVTWKKPGTTGCASMYLVKNAAFEEKLTEIKVANFLRDVAKVSLAEFSAQEETETSKD